LADNLRVGGASISMAGDILRYFSPDGKRLAELCWWRMQSRAFDDQKPVANAVDPERGSSNHIAQFQFTWAEPLEVVRFSHNQVHLWTVRLNQTPQELDLLEQTLISDERARAERFHFERDRRRFIAARGQLRMILSRYTGVHPRSLVFAYGARGKPSLSQAFDATGPRFNLTHSGELALLAVTQDRSVGVDVEEIHPIDAVEPIAQQFFSQRENAQLLAVPKARRLEAFFCCWTLKEAYLKATGDGLWRPTNTFDVALTRHQHSRLLSVAEDSQEASRWSLIQLAPERGYVGALAVEETASRLDQGESDPNKLEAEEESAKKTVWKRIDRRFLGCATNKSR
jgi:4'-phosphopantetheinyl transferase